MHSFTPPELATFCEHPSWCNQHGRIDRSACIEIRLAEVRKLAGCVPRKYEAARHVLPLPNETRAKNAGGRVATGIYTITAHEVHELNRTRWPRQLAGDWRTTRANAMRDEDFSSGARYHFRVKRNAPHEHATYDGLDPNPNHGACRTKMIGLPYDWTQPLRVEKWIFERRIQPAYYLICPGPRPLSKSACLPRFLQAQFARPSVSSVSSVVNPPPLSTCPRGRNSARKGCPQRTLKLMMAQCTEAEARDAEIAQLWIESLPPQLIPRLRLRITALLARYAPIMHPRTLLCPRCLGVRYGNNPENARQSWRRKQGKTNARPAKRKITKSNNIQWAAETKRRRKRGS
jgi:hypothetical protein